MKLSAKRLHVVLIAVIGLGVVALLLSVYLANLLLTGQSKKIAKAKLQTLVLQERQTQLSKARADITKYKGLAEIAKAIVPQDKDQAQTVREIVKIASDHSIRLSAVTFPSSTLGSKPGTAAAKSALSQLTPVKNISGVYSLTITVDSDSTVPATYDNFIKFLDALEHNRRTALVTDITIQPNASNPSLLTFSLTLNEYIKP